MSKIDATAIILKLIEVVPSFIPPPPRPKVDYSELINSIPRAKYPALISPFASEMQFKPVLIPKLDGNLITKEEAVETEPEHDERMQVVDTACLSCSRSHLSTVGAALNEAIRFARGDAQSIMHPEAQRRILMAEDEINIMERIDLSSDALQRSPAEEREVAEEYLPRIRKLRQDIGNIRSFDQLERVSSDANMLSQEFRLRHLQVRGVDLNPVVELAKKVQTGELTIAEAKAQLKSILPEE